MSFASRRFPSALVVMAVLMAAIVSPRALTSASAKTGVTVHTTAKKAKKNHSKAKKKPVRKKKTASKKRPAKKTKTTTKAKTTQSAKSGTTQRAATGAGSAPVAPSTSAAGAPAAAAAAPKATPATAATPSQRADAAQVSGGGRVGLATHLVWISEGEAYDQLRVLRAGGVRTIREDFDWSLTEQSRGNLDWTREDRVVAAAARAGISVLAIADYTPAWASSDPSPAKSKFFPPYATADYASYAAAIAKRYAAGGAFWKGRPDLTFTPLAGIELWNEPYGKWYFKPTPSPSRYAAMADQAATAIHAADAGVPVVAAGNLTANYANGTIGPWVASLLAADPALASLIDVWAVHPYASDREVGPDLGARPDNRFGFGSIPAVHAILAGQGITSPIWITEIGWSTAANADGAVSEAVQASYTTRALQRALGEFGSYVKRAYLFSWDTSSGASTDFDGNQGLRRADGSYKPAWQSIKSYVAGA